MKTRRADKADMERLDLLFLHGGMVAINEIGIALLGPPKSGKTSTSLALLGAAAASHVAENDLAVDCTGSQAVGLGWPRSICLRGDTLDDLDAVFPVLRPQIPALTHPYSGQCGADGVRLFHVLPQEIAQLTKRRILAEARIGMIVFPKFVGQGEAGPRLERLNATQVVDGLMENWDFVAERKVGASVAGIFEGTRGWAETCFNPFLTEAFPVPRIEVLRLKLLNLARLVPGFLLHQNLKHLSESCRLLTSEIAASTCL